MNEPWAIRSNTRQIKFNKQSNNKARAFLETHLLPELNDALLSKLMDKFSLIIDPNDS